MRLARREFADRVRSALASGGPARVRYDPTGSVPSTATAVSQLQPRLKAGLSRLEFLRRTPSQEEALENKKAQRLHVTLDKKDEKHPRLHRNREHAKNVLNVVATRRFNLFASKLTSAGNLGPQEARETPAETDARKVQYSAQDKGTGIRRRRLQKVFKRQIQSMEPQTSPTRRHLKLEEYADIAHPSHNESTLRNCIKHRFLSAENPSPQEEAALEKLTQRFLELPVNHHNRAEIVAAKWRQKAIDKVAQEGETLEDSDHANTDYAALEALLALAANPQAPVDATTLRLLHALKFALVNEHNEVADIHGMDVLLQIEGKLNLSAQAKAQYAEKICSQPPSLDDLKIVSRLAKKLVEPPLYNYTQAMRLASSLRTVCGRENGDTSGYGDPAIALQVLDAFLARAKSDAALLISPALELRMRRFKWSLATSSSGMEALLHFEGKHSWSVERKEAYWDCLRLCSYLASFKPYKEHLLKTNSSIDHFFSMAAERDDLATPLLSGDDHPLKLAHKALLYAKVKMYGGDLASVKQHRSAYTFFCNGFESSEPGSKLDRLWGRLVKSFDYAHRADHGWCTSDKFLPKLKRSLNTGLTARGKDLDTAMFSGGVRSAALQTSQQEAFRFKGGMLHAASDILGQYARPNDAGEIVYVQDGVQKSASQILAEAPLEPGQWKDSDGNVFDGGQWKRSMEPLSLAMQARIKTLQLAVHPSAQALAEMALLATRRAMMAVAFDQGKKGGRIHMDAVRAQLSVGNPTVDVSDALLRSELGGGLHRSRKIQLQVLEVWSQEFYRPRDETLEDAIADLEARHQALCLVQEPTLVQQRERYYAENVLRLHAKRSKRETLEAGAPEGVPGLLMRKTKESLHTWQVRKIQSRRNALIRLDGRRSVSQNQELAELLLQHAARSQHSATPTGEKEKLQKLPLRQMKARRDTLIAQDTPRSAAQDQELAYLENRIAISYARLIANGNILEKQDDMAPFQWRDIVNSVRGLAPREGLTLEMANKLRIEVMGKSSDINIASSGAARGANLGAINIRFGLASLRPLLKLVKTNDATQVMGDGATGGEYALGTSKGWQGGFGARGLIGAAFLEKHTSASASLGGQIIGTFRGKQKEAVIGSALDVKGDGNPEHPDKQTYMQRSADIAKFINALNSQGQRLSKADAAILFDQWFGDVKDIMLGWRETRFGGVGLNLHAGANARAGVPKMGIGPYLGADADFMLDKSRSKNNGQFSSARRMRKTRVGVRGQLGLSFKGGKFATVGDTVDHGDLSITGTPLWGRERRIAIAGARHRTTITKDRYGIRPGLSTRTLDFDDRDGLKYYLSARLVEHENKSSWCQDLEMVDYTGTKLGGAGNERVNMGQAVVTQFIEEMLAEPRFSNSRFEIREQLLPEIAKEIQLYQDEINDLTQKYSRSHQGPKHISLVLAKQVQDLECKIQARLIDQTSWGVRWLRVPQTQVHGSSSGWDFIFHVRHDKQVSSPHKRVAIRGGAAYKQTEIPYTGPSKTERQAVEEQLEKRRQRRRKLEQKLAILPTAKEIDALRIDSYRQLRKMGKDITDFTKAEVMNMPGWIENQASKRHYLEKRLRDHDQRHAVMDRLPNDDDLMDDASVCSDSGSDADIPAASARIQSASGAHKLHRSSDFSSVSGSDAGSDDSWDPADEVSDPWQ
jgi:hypothetical protein